MLKTDPLNQIKPLSGDDRCYKYLLIFRHQSRREYTNQSAIHRRAPFRVIVAPLFRDADDSHNAHLFFVPVSRFSESFSGPWTLKQLRAHDPRSSSPEEEIESRGAARASKTSLPQQWRTPILKRSNEDLPSLSHLPAARPKTYNKYLMGVILVGALPLRQDPCAGPHYDIRGIVGVSNLSTNNHQRNGYSVATLFRSLGALPSVPLPSPQEYVATSRSLARSFSVCRSLSPLSTVLIPRLYHSEWTTLFRCKASTTPHYPKHLNPDSWSPFSDSQLNLREISYFNIFKFLYWITFFSKIVTSVTIYTLLCKV